MGAGPDKKPRKKSIAQTVQRQNAWVKALEAKSQKHHNPNDKTRKTYEMKEKIKDGDGYKHMKVLKEFKLTLPEDANLTPEQQQQLFEIGRNAMIDITQQPLMFVAKEAGNLKMDLMRQQMLDNKEGEIFSKKKERMLKILLDIAKIAQRSQIEKNKLGKRIIGTRNEDIVIESGAFE